MFGLSFGELCVLLMVAMVVLGPKELPRYLRKAGQMTGKLRRLAYEMREKSGIDEVLRTEGLHQEIAELRKLARGEMMGVAAAVRSLTESARENTRGAIEAPSPYFAPALPDTSAPAADTVVIARERELPGEGPDAYGALPDTALVYEGSLVPSPLAEDGLYMRGVDTRADLPTDPVAITAAPRASAPASTPSA